MRYKILLFVLFFLSHDIYAQISMNRKPMDMVCNPGPKYSLINSIDYHPNQPLFCVTYTHNNKVILYEIKASGKPEVLQSLDNPLAELSQPQHAVFSPDGEKIVVANWKNQTLTIYQRKKGMKFHEKPVAIIPQPSLLACHKPHGITFSPCGNYLAIAYGAASYHGKAVALFRVKGVNFELVHMLQCGELPGIPKGITFSPDGTCLLVTFSDANNVVIFSLSENRQTILLPPRQVLQGKESGISRPEDIKITPNGKYCAVSNSDQNIVTFLSIR